MSRSTFYLHYEGIADLLAESSRLLVGRLVARFDGTEAGSSLIGRIRTCPEEELHLTVPAYLTPYLEFVRDNRRFFSTMVGHPEAFGLDDAFSGLEEHVLASILDRLRVPEEDRPYLMAFYLHGLIAIVARWIRGGCAEPMPYIAGLMQRCCSD